VNFEGTQRHYANWELRRDGEWVRAGDANDGAIDPAAPVWLRVERRGARVYGYHSADGATWATLEPIDVSLPAKVRVGVAAGHNTSTAYSPSFEGLHLYRAIVSIPVPADATPRAATTLLNGGTLILSGTAFQPATLTVRSTSDLGTTVNTLTIPKGTLTLSGSGTLLTQGATTLSSGSTIKLDSGPGFTVGEIRIVGNSQIAEEAIRERLGFTTGKTITATDLQEAEKRLRESRIFKHPPTVTAVDPSGG
jgi:hypothetical protein